MSDLEQGTYSDNPYLPPAVDYGDGEQPPFLSPSGMVDKVREALRLFVTNFRLFSAIILTVWLPGNLVINYLDYHVYGEETLAVAQFTMAIGGLFSPLWVAALIYSLGKLKSGNQPTYAEAMSAGFANWGRLFTARFVAGFLILLGYLALIIPGIVLTVRYALLDSAVVLERAGPTQARRRSERLTEGVRWQICAIFVLSVFAYMLLAALVYAPMELFPSINNMGTAVLGECILDVTFSVVDIIMFLYYWEATQARKLEVRTETYPPSETNSYS